MAKLHIDEKVPIDLSAALLTASIVQVKVPVLEPEEEFTPKFIDCDVTPLMTQKIRLDEYCEVDARHLLQVGIPLRGEKSTFGKVFCRKYCMRKKPYVPHVFVTRESPKIFKFDSESPDEVITRNLERAKGRKG